MLAVPENHIFKNYERYQGEGPNAVVNRRPAPPDAPGRARYVWEVIPGRRFAPPVSAEHRRIRKARTKRVRTTLRASTLERLERWGQNRPKTKSTSALLRAFLEEHLP